MLFYKVKQVSTHSSNRIPRHYAYSLQLLQNARVKVLVPVAVLECILSSFLGGGDRGAEILQLLGEAHAHFERINHHPDTRYGVFQRAPVETEGPEPRWGGIVALGGQGQKFMKAVSRAVKVR